MTENARMELAKARLMVKNGALQTRDRWLDETSAQGQSCALRTRSTNVRERPHPVADAVGPYAQLAPIPAIRSKCNESSK